MLTIIDAYQNDIRQNFLVDLRVDRLSSVTAAIPFVDAAKNGVTPFALGIGTFQNQLVPALVATLSGYKDTIAHFEPVNKVSVLASLDPETLADCMSPTGILQNRREPVPS